MSTRPVVLVTSRSFSSGTRDVAGELDRAGFEVLRGSLDHDLQTLEPALSAAVAWIAGTSPVTSAHLDAAPGLKVVARYGVGTDNVDLAAAASRGVVVTNTPGANANAVAEHTLALILASVRGVLRGDRAVRAGDWTASRSRELRTMTVGLLGFGRIGQATAARLRALGARVLATDPVLDAALAAQHGVEAVGAEELPERADLVSLHAPGGRVAVDETWLARFAGPRFLVNTARADLVDEPALVRALQSNPDLHYAADSLLHEHGVGPESPLCSPELVDQVIITPHLAANTVESIDEMGAMSVSNTLAVLTGSVPPNLVTPEPTRPR